MAPKIVDLRPTLQHSSRSPDRKPAPEKQKPAHSKKPVPLRTRRRRLRALIIASGIAIFLLGLWGVHWFSYRSAVRISDVSVRGAMLQDPGSVVSFVKRSLDDGAGHFIARDNIFAYPKEELRAGILSNFPRLLSVRLGRSGPFGTTLIVNVDERSAYATWCASGGAQTCFVFDEGGLIYAEAANSGKPAVPYVFTGGVSDGSPVGSVFLKDRLAGLLELMQRLREGRFEPSTVHVLDEQDFTITLKNGFTIKASFGQNIDTLVHNLDLVSVSPALRGREADLEYIDLRFGDRVYYKFKNETSPEDATPAQ